MHKENNTSTVTESFWHADWSKVMVYEGMDHESDITMK